MLRLLILLAASLVTTACVTVLDQARIEVAEDASSTARLLMSVDSQVLASVNSNGFEVGSRSLTKYEQMARECGAATRMFGGTSVYKVFLEINFSAATRDELDVALQCAKSHYRWFPELSIETSDGIFGRRYRLKLHQIVDRVNIESGTAHEFTFTMPGEITEFIDQTRGWVRTTSTMVGGNRIRIRLEILPDSVRATTLRACPDGGCEKRKIDVGFQVTSTKSKIDLQVLLAVVGTLFGSGLLVEVIRRFTARKKRAS